jgi:RNA polymerase sigma-70 factor (ECF subfamily)
VVRQFRLADKRNIQREVPLRNAAEVDELIDLSTPSTKLAAHEETDRLQRSLARLPDDYRQIILLRNLERRKFEEIAALMDRTVGAVKKLWSRAIMKLKQEMNADERR